ncbi:MAG: ceramidase domain-containing protein [Saprospirales bacterium]|nr:ceramidase domain-containing protein [Saprospirales bacterium]
MNKNTFKITLVLTVIVLIVFYVALQFHWFGVANGTGAVFCEASRNTLFIQPVNSFSNIGFVLSGLYCAYLISNSTEIKNNFFYAHPFIAKFYCIITVLLGPCSMAMHATETSLGGLFDMNSMYLFAAFMFSYAITRFYKLSNLLFTFIYILIIVLCNIAGQYRTVFGVDFYAGSAAFGLVCVLGMLFELLNFKKNKIDIHFKYAVLCSVSFLLAFGVWHFGKNGHCFCNPTSWFQWHGVWHLLCGLSTYFLFRYYISEDLETN